MYNFSNIFPPLRIEKKPSHRKGKQISHPLLLDQYLAIADYEKQGRNEVSLQTGRKVEVVEKTEIGKNFLSIGDSIAYIPLQREPTCAGVCVGQYLNTRPTCCRCEHVGIQKANPKHCGPNAKLCGTTRSLRTQREPVKYRLRWVHKGWVCIGHVDFHVVCVNFIHIG